MPLKLFLEILQPHSRYPKCSPNIAPSIEEKLKTKRHVDQNIFQEELNFPTEKNFPSQPLPRVLRPRGDSGPPAEAARYSTLAD